MRYTLLVYSFEPRPNSLALGTAGFSYDHRFIVHNDSKEILITDLPLILHVISINIFTYMSYLERALINVYVIMHSFYVNQRKVTKLRSVVK